MIKSRKKTIYTVFLTVVILVTLVFSVVSYGWLVNYIHGDFGFSAKELSPFTLHLAKIKMSAGETEVTEEQREYQQITKYIEANTDGSHLEVSLGNMSFGTIDNVAQLKKENVVYLRLTVPKSLGDTVKLNLHYSVADFIVLYKNVYNGDVVTGTERVTDPEILDNLLALEGKVTDVANNSFLLYDAVVSNTECEAGKIAETFESTATASSEEKFQDSNYKKFVTDTVYQADCAAETPLYTQTLINPNYDSVAEDGNYYVYIKVVPNLAVLAYSIEYISGIMPCYIYYNISATFESGTLPKQENSAV